VIQNDLPLYLIFPLHAGHFLSFSWETNKTAAVKLLKEANAMVVAGTLDTTEKRKKSPDSSANKKPDIQTTAHHYADYINHKILAKSPMVGFGLLLKKEYTKANTFFWLYIYISVVNRQII
jgi:hypothetical protein